MFANDETQILDFSLSMAPSYNATALNNITSIPPKLSLLSLPFEIRVKINRNLLLNARPIEYKSDAPEAVPNGPYSMTHESSIASGDSEAKYGKSLHLGIERDCDRPGRFQVAILRVCHQLCAEGCDILYGENTFALMIRLYGFAIAGMHSLYGLPSKQIKNFEIIIENLGEPSVLEYQKCVREVVHKLSDSPKLRRLSIRIEASPCEVFDQYCCSFLALQPFGLLREVQEVTFMIFCRTTPII